MVKMILLSCHRVSLKTPNSYCHRICVIVSHGRHALNLETFIQALNLHKQNSEFSSVVFVSLEVQQKRPTRGVIGAVQ